jgi:hypothetical protein
MAEARNTASRMYRRLYCGARRGTLDNKCQVGLRSIWLPGAFIQHLPQMVRYICSPGNYRHATAQQPGKPAVKQVAVKNVRHPETLLLF